MAAGLGCLMLEIAAGAAVLVQASWLPVERCAGLVDSASQTWPMLLAMLNVAVLLAIGAGAWMVGLPRRQG